MGAIVSGKSRGGAAHMASYALAQGKNELSEIMEVNGIEGGSPADVRAAFSEMDAIAKGTRCGQFIYHAQINPEKGDHLTPGQWREAVNTLEKELKLEGHQRVVWRDVKEGREHYHIAWNRIDPETMKAVNMGNDFRAHERAAVKIEKAFGLEPVEYRPNLGGRGRDPNGPAPMRSRAPKDWEFQQGERTGLDPRLMRETVSQLQEQSRDGREFAAALDDMGFKLARGSKCGFVVLDGVGGVHNLRTCTGLKAGNLSSFMEGVELDTRLPTVAEAKKEIRNELKTDLSQIKIISRNGREFAENLGECGFILAQGDKRDFVVIDQGGGVHNLAKYSGVKVAELRAFMGDIDRDSLPTVTEAKTTAKAKQNAALDMLEERPETELKQIFAQEERQAIAPEGTAKEGEKFKIGGAALKVAEAGVDVVFSAIDALLGQPEPKKITPAEYLRDVKARQAYNQQKAEEAGKAEKRAATLDDLRGGKPLEVAMLQTLSRADLETLKAQGVESGVQEIIRQQERYYERERERQRER